MEDINICDYLGDFDKAKRTGSCKLCSLPVSWSRERLAGHKRSNCKNATVEEKTLFKKRKFVKNQVSEFQPRDGSFSDADMSLNDPDNSKDVIDSAVAIFFYRTGIAFRIADSPAWKDLVALLNPKYAKDMPCLWLLCAWYQPFNQRYSWPSWVCFNTQGRCKNRSVHQ